MVFFRLIAGRCAGLYYLDFSNGNRSRLEAEDEGAFTAGVAVDGIQMDLQPAETVHIGQGGLNPVRRFGDRDGQGRREESVAWITWKVVQT